MEVRHAILLPFLFVLGSCIGSFLNVVVWRLPRVDAKVGETHIKAFFRALYALSEPPSHCPNCNKLLKWYDNLPVIGWIKLGGKCRFCRQRFSIRYPVVEAITGLMFVGYYLAFFIFQTGPCVHLPTFGNAPARELVVQQDWWVYGLDMMLLSGLLAASLIDAELFIIPIEIPWLLGIVGIIVHGIFDTPTSPGNVLAGPIPAAMALGGVIGLVVSFILLSRTILTASFADGAPLLEVERDERTRRKAEKKSDNSSGEKIESSDDPEPREWSRSEVRREIRKEMAFLMPPLFLAMLFAIVVGNGGPIGAAWQHLVARSWVGAVLGSVLGGLVGGFVVWLTRILGSLAFGREAMGMGDVDLMLGVGAVLGAGAATLAFFLAPFFGIVLAIYMLCTGKKRELPYGPYLSLATAFVILYYCPIAAYFAPGLSGLLSILRGE